MIVNSYISRLGDTVLGEEKIARLPIPHTGPSSPTVDEEKS